MEAADTQYTTDGSVETADTQDTTDGTVKCYSKVTENRKHLRKKNTQIKLDQRFVFALYYILFNIVYIS